MGIQVSFVIRIWVYIRLGVRFRESGSFKVRVRLSFPDRVKIWGRVIVKGNDSVGFVVSL